MVEIDIQKLYMPLPEAIKVNGRWYVRVTGKDFENFCRLEETSRNGKLILIEKIKADANKRLESEISCLKNVVSYAIDKYAHPDKYKDDLTDAEKQMFPSQRRLLKKKTSKI